MARATQEIKNNYPAEHQVGEYKTMLAASEIVTKEIRRVVAADLR